MRLSLILFASLFLIACSTTPSSNRATKDSPVTIIKRDFARVLEGNFRGQLTLSNGKGYFDGCDINKTFTVKTSPELSNIYEKIATPPSTPVYIEFAGEITFSNSAQNKEDVLMRIDKVHHMAHAKASLQCAKAVDSFLFKAQGDDPYWRANIDTEQLLFSTKASNQAYDLKDSNFKTAQFKHINTINKQDQQLKLTILPGDCYDLTYREYWGYKTTVNSLWGEYKGCGEPGWHSEDQSLIGDYLSNSNNKHINLTLNANYSVQYNEKIDGAERVKTGFWKSNSPRQVVVMLSKEGNKNIRQELILQRNNLTLATTELNNNHVITQFLDGALTFNKMNAGEPQVEVARIERVFNAQSINPDNKLDVQIQRTINDYFKIHRTDPKDTKFSTVKYDLNGDGFDEAIVLLNWCNDNTGCELLIFSGDKNGNYQFSSRISPVNAPIIISTTQQFQWQSLLIEGDSGWSQLRFDGLSYPTQSDDVEQVSKEDYSTGVVLFSQGKPTQWFPIKE